MEISKQARQWAMFAHISSLVLFLGIPFGNIVAPLIIWLLKREIDPYIDEQGKESVNFQISITLYAFIAGLLCFVFIGLALLPLIAIFDIVFVIKATLKADKGLPYHYPNTLRFVK